MNSLPNDIESIVEIGDFSLYYLIALIFFGTIAIYFIIKYILKFIKSRKDNRKVYIQILKNLDWSNSKETAYQITKYGRLIKVERGEKLLEDLILELDIYKYRKETSKISDKIKGQFKVFMEVVESE